MSTGAVRTPVTLRSSWSFYVPGTDTALVEACVGAAGSVTIRGADGPKVARGIYGGTCTDPILFDYAGYESNRRPIDPVTWYERQESVGADRLLTPGRWVPYDKTDPGVFLDAVSAERNVGEIAGGSTIVLAIDYRWFAKAHQLVIDTIEQLGHPVAIVLAHRQDPMSANGVHDAILALLRKVPSASLLRSDHAAIGAVAFGAAHGSIGLRPSYRHFVPPKSGAGGRQFDRTPRVFVRDLMDWFTAATVAGWGATAVDVTCPLECCRGARIDRFFNPRYEAAATVHNRMTLAELAHFVVGDEPEARRRSFAEMCAIALDHYGPMGKLSNITEPSDQLVRWAAWA